MHMRVISHDNDSIQDDVLVTQRNGEARSYKPLLYVTRHLDIL